MLNEAPPGIKVFCGKLIYLNFQHVLETEFMQARVSDNIYESEYCSDDEEIVNTVNYRVLVGA